MNQPGVRCILFCIGIYNSPISRPIRVFKFKVDGLLTNLCFGFTQIKDLIYVNDFE